MNAKFSFGKIVIAFGVITCLLGITMAIIGSVFMNDPTLHLTKGETVTGLVLFSIGIYTIIIGVLEKK